VACQRRRSTCRAVLVAAATTTASPIAMPKKTATAATLIKPFIAHAPPGHHRALPEPLTLPIKPLPNHHRGGQAAPLEKYLINCLSACR